jgi:tetratricopeptide (TPR) repeat protein
MQESHSGFFRQPIVQITFLALLALFVYSNTFQAPFAFDDETSIIDNPIIRSLSGFLSDGYAYNPRRFIGYLTLALNYHFGGFTVTGYHVVNLAVHIASGLLVYWLVQLTFRTPFLRRSLLAPRSDLLALAVALLFVVHPIQTQAVTYIVQRFASLATLFYLAALVLHVRWRLASEAGKEFFSGSVLPSFLLSLVAALLAMKTKEIAFTLPFVVLLYEFAFFGRPGMERLASLVPMLLTAAIIPVSMVGVGKLFGVMLSDVDKSAVTGQMLSRWDYLCTQFGVVVTYLRLIFLPVGQNLDYDYPASHSLFEAHTLFSLLLLLTLFSASLLFWRRAGRGGDTGLRLAAFGILWFFVTLSVESSVIPIIDVIFEHRVYLPSVGIFIALVTLCAIGAEKMGERIPVAVRLQLPLLLVVTILLAVTAHARNMVWKDGITLWSDAIVKSPNKARPINNLGRAYQEMGQHQEAVKYLVKAIALQPNFAMAHNNLGISYAGKGERDAAIRKFRDALLIDPGLVTAHNNLGRTLVDMGDMDGSIKSLREALRLKPQFALAHSNLGFCLASRGELDAGIAEFNEALRLDPNLVDAHNYLGFALAGKGKLDAAVDQFHMALKIDPNSPNAHIYLGIVFSAKGQIDSAILEFRETLRIDPLNAKAQENLKTALARKGVQSTTGN